MGGLLTKVGVYALLRTLVMLLPSTRDTLAPVLGGVAIATLILGPLSAIAETNLRRAIGFILIGGVGVTVLCLGSDQPAAIAGATLYVFHSMLTLAALYLVAGLIERATGATETTAMRGLYGSNLVQSALFFTLFVSISGVPPFLGFWPKLLILQGLLATPDWLGTFAILLNSLLTLLAGARLWSHIFWRGPPSPKIPLPAAPVGAAILLTATIFLFSLWPGLLVAAADIAATDLLDPARYIAAVGLAP
jgi:multicomponent Na+:H+ antiporter subunit D